MFKTHKHGGNQSATWGSWTAEEEERHVSLVALKKPQTFASTVTCEMVVCTSGQRRSNSVGLWTLCCVLFLFHLHGNYRSHQEGEPLQLLPLQTIEFMWAVDSTKYTMMCLRRKAGGLTRTGRKRRERERIALPPFYEVLCRQLESSSGILFWKTTDSLCCSWF